MKVADDAYVLVRAVVRDDSAQASVATKALADADRAISTVNWPHLAAPSGFDPQVSRFRSVAAGQVLDVFQIAAVGSRRNIGWCRSVEIRALLTLGVHDAEFADIRQH